MDKDASAWTDTSGNLWLLFGSGVDSQGSDGTLSDVWDYTPSLGTWTWMAGASTVNAAGIYGSGANSVGTPGARLAALTGLDAAGNLWLLGGSGYDLNDTCGELNDLWQFAP